MGSGGLQSGLRWSSVATIGRSGGSWQEAALAGDVRAERWLAMAHIGTAVVLAVGIFALDIVSPLQGAVAVLYSVVVLIVARTQRRRVVLAVAAACAGLALAGYLISHHGQPFGSPAVRLAVSLVALIVTAWLSTRQIAAAGARQQADARYRMIFGAAGIAMWESDWSAAHMVLRGGVYSDAMIGRATAAAVIRDANDQAARLFGYPDRRAMLAGDVATHATPSAIAAQKRIFTRLLSGDRLIEEDVQFRTLTGDVIDVLLRVTLPPHDQDWQHVLITAFDVTERRRAAQRLADAQAELAHMARLTTLGELAATIAHEVNQPLSAIITYAKSGRRWLAQEAPDARETDDCLDHIAANGTRAADVIARIRDLARKSGPQRATVSIADLVTDTIALLARDLAAAEVAIDLAIPDDVPAVDGDRVQLQQVLMNLMLNAQQAMAAQSTPRALSIEARAAKGQVVLTLADTGPGFGDTDPDMVFRPFFTTKREGIGIGLSICRSIVEQHGGTLVAAAAATGGAAMTIRLPVQSGDGGRA